MAVDLLPDGDDADRPGAQRPVRRHTGLDLLANEIPLTLIIDLASRVDSREMYAHEPGTTDLFPEAS